MQFLRVGTLADFENQDFRVYRVLARRIGVRRNPDGTFRAMELACRHQNADLSQVKAVGGAVTCPRHGWKYDLRTGACLAGGDLPLRRFGVKVESGGVYLTISPLEDGAAEPEGT